MKSKLLACLASVALATTTFAADAAKPVGQPLLDAPTLKSLGVHWIVEGDDNANAAITLQYRKPGGAWQSGLPLFRVEKGAHDPLKADYKESTRLAKTLLEVPDNAWLFAGSALMLEPGTEYELKVTLKDPDGGQAEHTLKAATAAEPVAPASMNVRKVPVGQLADALKTAKPGDLLLLAAGVHQGPVKITASGEPGRPIILRGEDRETTVIQGGAKSAAEISLIDERAAAKAGTPLKHEGFAERIIDATGIHDVWFENLTVSHGRHGIVAHDSARLVLRNGHLRDVFFGLTATKNSGDTVSGFFILDNLIEGVSKWPRTKEMGIEDSRGVQIVGSGHVVAYNRIRAFGDAIDTYPSARVEAIDFHNNDIDLMTDDGIETDYSQRNVRVFENRLTNVHQGISGQPVYGGPVYVFRNTMYGVTIEPFKLHNGPSGMLLMHNTVVKKGIAWEIWSSKPMHHIVSRNNLMIGTAGSYAFVSESGQNPGCDFDYDGFGGSFKQFAKWNKQKYPTLEATKANAPIYKHAVMVDPATAFASGVRPPEDENAYLPPVDLRLAPGSAAIDAGQPMPGLNDGFKGSAPDLGAFEAGQDLPQYGPRKGT
jgi:hypothetical protein